MSSRIYTDAEINENIKAIKDRIRTLKVQEQIETAKKWIADPETDPDVLHNTKLALPILEKSPNLVCVASPYTSNNDIQDLEAQLQKFKQLKPPIVATRPTIFYSSLDYYSPSETAEATERAKKSLAH